MGLKSACLGCALAAFLALFVAPARAQHPCSVALVMALDVSGSVDIKEYQLQRKGIAKAFRDDDLIDLIEFLPGGIAVAVSQWSGPFDQQDMLGWHRITTRQDALKFAAAVETISREHIGAMTATGNALLHADLVLRSNPYQCAKQVIDISSDGRANRGTTANIVSDRLELNGTTINVLAILEDDNTLIDYFAEHIIAGSSAFVESANTYGDYFEAIKRKLLRELAPNYVQKKRCIGSARLPATNAEWKDHERCDPKSMGG